jgi:stage II sporulation protein AA (anti-sigma F factor antagonist)
VTADLNRAATEGQAQEFEDASRQLGFRNFRNQCGHRRRRLIVAAARPDAVDRENLQSGCREIHLEGELDLAVADRLSEALERAASEQCRVVIGLEQCTFIDSTGIAIIVKAHRELAKQGHTLTIYGASDQVLRILSITGLTDNGLVFENAGDAHAAAGESG